LNGAWRFVLPVNPPPLKSSRPGCGGAGGGAGCGGNGDTWLPHSMYCSAMRRTGSRITTMYAACSPSTLRDEKMCNRRKGFRAGDRSRGRFATPADLPLQGCSSYRELHVRRESLGGIRPSFKAIFCYVAPCPNSQLFPLEVMTAWDSPAAPRWGRRWGGTHRAMPADTRTRRSRCTSARRGSLLGKNRCPACPRACARRTRGTLAPPRGPPHGDSAWG
jgi:hypothetical protein